MRSPLPKTKNGQSLLEAIVALAVAMLVILALVWVTTISIRNADYAKKQTQAANYAQEGMEKVRAYRDQHPWDTFTSGCESPEGLTPLPSPFVREIACHLKDSTDNCSFANDTCQVSLTVSWTDSSGTHKSELISYFTKW